MGKILKRTNLDQVPDLSDGVQSKLEGIGITTAELLAYSVPEEISSRIGISRERTLEHIRHAKQTIGFGGFKTHFEMEEASTPLLGTGFVCIDKALEGGFRSGSIIEIQGQQGAGKTLMCSHLAIIAQLIDTDDGSTPKVIWYDSEQSYRNKRIKEIAYRYRMDPGVALRNIILVDVAKKGIMEPSLETVRKTLARHHVSLVIIDSLYKSMKYLEQRSTHTKFIANISRLAQATGTIVVLTNRTRIGFSRSVLQEYERSSSLSSMLDYELHFHLEEEGKRTVVPTDHHTYQDAKCKLYIGHGGFFETRASLTMDAGRVQRYLKKS